MIVKYGYCDRDGVVRILMECDHCGNGYLWDHRASPPLAEKWLAYWTMAESFWQKNLGEISEDGEFTCIHCRGFDHGHDWLMSKRAVDHTAGKFT